MLTAVAVDLGCSAADIARTTGLGAQTVSRIVANLEADGLIYRGEVVRGRRGQPASRLFMDPNGAFCLGCEIGWRSLTILVRNLGGEVLGQHQREYAFPDANSIVSEAGSLAKLLVSLVPEQFRSRIIGLGIAMPSSIARNANLLGADPEQSSAWTNLDVVGQLQQMTGLEIFLHNDGNAGCWAELAAYPVPRPNNMAYFLVGTFVAAGLIADGRLWEGTTKNAADLGSMIASDRAGNRNIVHLVASIFAFEELLRGAEKAVPKGHPSSWDWEPLEPQASHWLELAADALAVTVVNAAAVSDFSVAVIDGTLPDEVVDRLIILVREKIAALPILVNDTPRIERGRLAGLAPARGAALKPIYRRLFAPTGA